MITFCPRCGAQFGQVFKGEWFETAVRCGECGLTVADPPLMLARNPSDEEVEYSLTEWLVPERAAATAALADVDIPYRWEDGLVLVVPAVAEDEVDLLLEDLDPPGEPAGEQAVDDAAGLEDPEDDGDGDGFDEDEAEGDDVDGGEEAQVAMADLFVAADRLQHDPADRDLGAEVKGLAATVGACPPPYGIARPVWRRIQGLAATLVAGLEDGAGTDAVTADSRALRDFLRDLV
jgi:hypothetical protein